MKTKIQLRTQSSRRLLSFIAVALGFLVHGVRAETNLVITSFQGNGELSWSAPTNLESVTVEWSPTASGPWSSSWNQLVALPNTNAVRTVSVPMFYRVVGKLPQTATLLIHADGSAGSQSFVDESGHALAVFGNAQVATNVARFGNGSALFDGNGDYLVSSLSQDWAFGTNDFTVDFQAWMTSLSFAQFIGLHQPGAHGDWLVYLNPALQLCFGVSGSYTITTTWSPTVNTWHHIAITRKDGYCRIFADGQIIGESSLPQNLGVNHPLAIGAAEDGELPMAGYLDEIRILKGTAAWSAAFTPPAAAYP